MSPLSYDYSYKAYKHKAFLDERNEEYKKLKDVLEEFTYLREKIFELRYAAEQVDVAKINETSISEFILILPVIVKLSEVAECISSRDLADLEKKNRRQE